MSLESAAAERRYALHLTHYPALRAYHEAMAAWYEGSGERPVYGPACEREHAQKKRDLDSHARYEREAGAEDGSWEGGW